MIIVLETSGKNIEVNYVKVITFNNISDAQSYCEQNTDYPKNKRHWKYCEIINENQTYEVTRYYNFKETV